MSDSRNGAHVGGYFLGYVHGLTDPRRAGGDADHSDARCLPLEREKDDVAAAFPRADRPWFMDGYDAGYTFALTGDDPVGDDWRIAEVSA